MGVNRCAGVRGRYYHVCRVGDDRCGRGDRCTHALVVDALDAAVQVGRGAQLDGHVDAQLIVEEARLNLHSAARLALALLQADCEGEGKA